MAAKTYITIEALDKATPVFKKFDQQTNQAFDHLKRNAKASTASMGSSIDKLKTHWIGITVAMAAAITIAKKFVDAASNLQEATSKFNVVFKDQIDLAEKWAQQLVDSYAMSTREAKEYLSSVQDLLVPMGMASDQAGLMSSKIVKLAADLGSFNNMPTARVMADIQSGLVGNYETMKKYGVVLNATIVQEKALAMGLAATKSELTAGQKAHAAYTLMVEGSKAAIGDMSRTQDDYANQMKALKAKIEDISASIGSILLPALSKWAGELANILDYWDKLFAGPKDPVLNRLKEQREAIMSEISLIGESDSDFAKWYLGQEKAEETLKRLNAQLKNVNASIATYNKEQSKPPKPSGAPGVPGAPEAPAATGDYYKDQMEEWKQVTADFYAMKEAREKADLAQHKATLAEWGQVTADFAEAEQVQWEQQTESYLALEEIKNQAHQEEMTRYEEVMAANEEYMKQYEVNERKKAQLAQQAAITMLANWNDAFAQLAKGSETAFQFWKATAIAETIIDTYVAAQAAFKAMAGIPVVGPGLAVAAAAAAIAAGMARVSAIKGQEPAAMYHTGGIVGRGSQSSKLVSPDVFTGAQRAHTGLGPDERPVIVKKDEGIFTKEQMAAMGAGDEESGRIDFHVHVIFNGREVTKDMAHTLETDGILLDRFRRALS